MSLSYEGEPGGRTTFSPTCFVSHAKEVSNVSRGSIFYPHAAPKLGITTQATLANY